MTQNGIARPLPVFSFALLLFAGCYGSGPRVVTTLSPGIESIPVTIGMFPMLTTEAPRPRPWTGVRPMTLEGKRIYIQPPTQSKLMVTLESQMLTDMLAAELSYQGFRLKELPVETVPADPDKDDERFSISLEVLEHLRENYNLKAILLGNVYFVRDPYRSSNYRIKAAYLRLVDIETLDVLCHVSIDDEYDGAEKTFAAVQLAEKMAEMAHLAPPPKE